MCKYLKKSNKVRNANQLQQNCRQYYQQGYKHASDACVFVHLSTRKASGQRKAEANMRR